MNFQFLTDALFYIQKARVSAQVREIHLAKNEEKCELTEEVLVKTGELEKWLDGKLAAQVRAHPAYPWFSKVKGIGDINIGKIISDVDIEKASQISKLWRYCGFGCDDAGRAERRTKGEKLHFNSRLKTMCWRLGKSLVRAKGAYYKFYRQEKDALSKREMGNGRAIVPSANLPKEKGKHVETDEFVGLGHVDMMAFRKMIKLFLAHLWTVWRAAEGLEVTAPYAGTVLGHTGILDPWEFVEKDN